MLAVQRQTSTAKSMNEIREGASKKRIKLMKSAPDTTSTTRLPLRDAPAQQNSQPSDSRSLSPAKVPVRLDSNQPATLEEAQRYVLGKQKKLSTLDEKLRDLEQDDAARPAIQKKRDRAANTLREAQKLETQFLTAHTPMKQ